MIHQEAAGRVGLVLRLLLHTHHESPTTQFIHQQCIIIQPQCRDHAVSNKYVTRETHILSRRRGMAAQCTSIQYLTLRILNGAKQSSEDSSWFHELSRLPFSMNALNQIQRSSIKRKHNMYVKWGDTGITNRTQFIKVTEEFNNPLDLWFSDSWKSKISRTHVINLQNQIVNIIMYVLTNQMPTQVAMSIEQFQRYDRLRSRRKMNYKHMNWINCQLKRILLRKR